MGDKEITERMRPLDRDPKVIEERTYVCGREAGAVVLVAFLDDGSVRFTSNGYVLKLPVIEQIYDLARAIAAGKRKG